MDINVNGVNITLTKEQLKQIAAQTKEKYTINDIDSVLSACDVLGIAKPSRFDRESDSQWAGRQLEIIIKAMNYIDNDYKEYTPNFTDGSYKYLPYFNKTSRGWVVYAVYYCCYGSSGCPVVLYYKNRDSANVIANKFISLYNKYIG